MPAPTDWWERLYRTAEIRSLPWYTEKLDPDVGAALEALGPAQGRVLDLGTGPGTHAVDLARLGYDVVATDISRTAVEKAKALARKARVRIEFHVENILDSHLEDGCVDVVVDRGTFHVLPPETRARYVSEIRRILRPRGILLLKTFSDQEPGTDGPYRLSPGELRSYFREGFELLGIDDTVFQGTEDPAPKALFARFRRLG